MTPCHQFFENKVQTDPFNFKPSKDFFLFLKAIETLLKKINIICRLIFSHNEVENLLEGFRS